MRETMGKFITVFNAGKHGAGSTTIANALGIALEYYTGKKVLLVNKSGYWSSMEKFIENNIQVQYTIDNLKVFNSSITAKIIETYATMINENLYMIAGSSINDENDKLDNEFEENFCDECMKAYDIVIADLPSRVKETNIQCLNKADLIIAVTKYNEIDLDDIYTKPDYVQSKEILLSDKTYTVINYMDRDWDIPKEISRLKKQYSFKNAYGFVHDGSIINACCKQRQMYSFLRDELDKEKYIFPQQMKEFSLEIAKIIDTDQIEKPKKSFLKQLFKK